MIERLIVGMFRLYGDAIDDESLPLPTCILKALYDA